MTRSGSTPVASATAPRTRASLLDASSKRRAACVRRSTRADTVRMPKRGVVPSRPTGIRSASHHRSQPTSTAGDLRQPLIPQ